MHPDELENKQITDDFIKIIIRRDMMNKALDMLEAKGIGIDTDKAAYLHILRRIEKTFEDYPDALEPNLFKKGIRYINFKSLVPLAHPTLDNYYRVPIKVTKTQYKVYVDKGCVRIFTQVTVPPHLISKITMAKAASDNTTKDNDLYEYDLFMTKDKNGMADVAWQASESMYTIVLHETELKKLQGDKL
jgi:hypothetical protein